MNYFFKKNQISVILAPLAGISDLPFRIVSCLCGADLCYTEMISSCALLFDNNKTLRMLESDFCRSSFMEEVCGNIDNFKDRLGVQIVGKNAENISKAIVILDKFNFSTIDINMGCPVPKVVKSGSGSAMLKNPSLIQETLKQSRNSSQKPMSVKIRLGWDQNSINAIEISKIAEKEGMDWICVHGRTRSQNYSYPVNLDYIKEVKQNVSIPVVANGNIFSKMDSDLVLNSTGVDAVMVARAALGNPWIFNGIKGKISDISIEEWFRIVSLHLKLQKDFYSDDRVAAITMRKHLLWYIKGWQNGRVYKDKLNRIESIDEGLKIIEKFYNETIHSDFCKKPVFQMNFDKSRYIYS